MRIFQITLLVVMAIISLGAISISAYMNWIWGQTLSAIPLYKTITGAIALVFDLVKAFLPLIGVVAVSAGIAFSHKNKNAFMVLLSFGSIWAAFLFLTSNRMDSFALLKSQVSNRTEVIDDIAVKIKEIKGIRKHRPFVVVDADYTSRCYTDKRKRWRSCKRLMKERGRALAAMDLKKELKELKADKRSMKVIGSASGGLDNVSEVTGVDVKRISNIQAFMTAIMLEVLTGYVPALVFAALFSVMQIMKKEREEKQEKEKKVQETLALQSREVEPASVQEPVQPSETTPEIRAVGETDFMKDVLNPIYAEQEQEQVEARRVAALSNDAASYFAGRCRFRQGAALNSIQVHGDYQDWCRSVGVAPQNYVDFTRDLYVYLVQKLGDAAVDGDINNSALGSFITFRGIDIVSQQTAIETRSFPSTVVPISA